jgi:hypothetical protein
LRELRNKFSSVELQHKSLDWWGDWKIVKLFY